MLKVIDETLSPVWDELLVFEEILVYGRREDIKTNPPTVIIEIYDQDKVSTFSWTRASAEIQLLLFLFDHSLKKPWVIFASYILGG